MDTTGSAEATASQAPPLDPSKLLREFRVSNPGSLLCTVLLEQGAGLAELQAAIQDSTAIRPEEMRLFHDLLELTSPEGGDKVSALEPADGETHVDVLLVQVNASRREWLRRLEELPPDRVFRWFYMFAPPASRKDRVVVQAAVAKDPNALRVADISFRQDAEVVLEALAQTGEALDWASRRLFEDREFCLAAVALNGEALGRIGPGLAADREVVLAAVGQNGAALRYAAPSLKADRGVVSAAVKQSAVALQHASPELKSDPEFSA